MRGSARLQRSPRVHTREELIAREERVARARRHPAPSASRASLAAKSAARQPLCPRRARTARRRYTHRRPESRHFCFATPCRAPRCDRPSPSTGKPKDPLHSSRSTAGTAATHKEKHSKASSARPTAHNRESLFESETRCEPTKRRSRRLPSRQITARIAELATLPRAAPRCAALARARARGMCAHTGHAAPGARGTTLQQTQRCGRRPSGAHASARSSRAASRARPCSSSAPPHATTRNHNNAPAPSPPGCPTWLRAARTRNAKARRRVFSQRVSTSRPWTFASLFAVCGRVVVFFLSLSPGTCPTGSGAAIQRSQADSQRPGSCQIAQDRRVASGLHGV